MRQLVRALTAGFLLLAAAAHAQTLSYVGTFGGATSLSVAVSGNMAYVPDFSATTGGALTLFNVSNPALPLAVGSVNTGLPVPGRVMAVGGNTVYMVSYAFGYQLPASSWLSAINVSNPNAPVPSARILLPPPPVYLAASGSYVYVASASAPVVNIYDGNLAFVGSVNTLTPPTNLLVNAGTLYVTRSNIVTTYNLATTPTAPTLIGSSAPASIQAVSGTRAYGVVPADGTTVPITSLRGYDVTSTSRMAPLSVVNNSAIGPMVTATSGGRVVFTTGDANPTFNPPNTGSQFPLLAYNFTNPSQPTLAGQDNTISGAYAIASNGDYAYLATGIGVQIYTLSGLPLATRPAAPTALPLYPNPAHGTLTLPRLAPATPVTISDALGRVCLATPAPAGGILDINALPAGLYQVRAGTAVSKLVVE
jgi:hypothetical protein